MAQDIHNPHDRLFHQVWSQLEIGRDFLYHYLPAAVRDLLDLDSLELVKGSFVEKALRQHRTDLLYRVLLKDDEAAAYVYVLLEHKRAPERLTAFQLLRYIVRIWDRHQHRHPAQDLPPIVPLVVCHGDRPWPYG